jgi:hypothetical protein
VLQALSDEKVIRTNFAVDSDLWLYECLLYSVFSALMNTFEPVQSAASGCHTMTRNPLNMVMYIKNPQVPYNMENLISTSRTPPCKQLII